MPRCKICKEKFEPRFSSFQKTCLNESCIASWYLQEKERKEKKAWSERKKELERTSIGIPALKAKAKRLFQAKVRERDKGKPCFTCGAKEAKQWDAGHYYKAEIFSGVIFHPMNVHKQCSYCNDWCDGNLIPYRKALIELYGEEAVQELDKLANETRYKKWTREELYHIIEQINDLDIKIKREFTLNP